MILTFNGSGVYRGNGLDCAKGDIKTIEVTDELGDYLLTDYPGLFEAEVEEEEEKKAVARGRGRKGR